MTENKPTAPKKKWGRPSKYNERIATEVCERLAQGETLKAICDDLKISHMSVWRWQEANEEFSLRYARAREFQARSWFEEMVQAAKTPEYGDVKESGIDGQGNTWEKTKTEDQVAHRRLKIDTLKWAVSKILPREYGDKTVTEIVGKDGGAIKVESKSEITSMSTDDLMAIAHLQVDEQ